MTANTLPGPAQSLGGFLRDRRGRLQPGPGPSGRRRTPGLRREEVATRAGVSVTWYTWLEQGRGGPPSSDVLERLARALELDPAAREILFLLAQHRPPPVGPVPPAVVSPALQNVLDAMPLTPAVVKTPTWDIVAWNAAASALLIDYATLPIPERNILRRLFSDASFRTALPDWESNARFAIGVFRVDVARVGGSPEADALVAELQALSPEFRRLWAENDLQSHGMGMKQVEHPVVGRVRLETSAFAVDGAGGLTMIVFNPHGEADRDAMRTLLGERS